jgi:pimeloyl-ACP methyl ester carboxylesterase
MTTTPRTLGPPWFERAIAAPYRERSVEVEGCRVHYLAWGDPAKPSLLLVHGGAAHAHWWSFLAPLLCDQYYVVAPDLSGHGDSGRRDGYSMSLWARELVEVAAHADFVGLPVLVGHSMGGLASIAAASLHGDRLAGAIIVDSPVRRPDPESDEGHRGRSFRNPKTYATLEQALSRFRLVPEQPCENEFVVDYIARHSLVEVPGGFTWKFDPRIFTHRDWKSLQPYLETVRCRVALLRGEYSLVVPPETGAFMYELLDRNAPLVEIPEAHHHLILDQPLAFIAALRALLADWEHSVPRRSRRATPARAAAPASSATTPDRAEE